MSAESKALVPEVVAPRALFQDEKVADRLVALRERVNIRRMRRIIEQGTCDATQIDDDGPAPVPAEGERAWKADRLRIARDMRKAKRHAPVYLDHAAAQLKAHDDREAARQMPTQLNIGTINVVQAAVYPAIEMEVKE